VAAPAAASGGSEGSTTNSAGGGKLKPGEGAGEGRSATPDTAKAPPSAPAGPWRKSFVDVSRACGGAGVVGMDGWMDGWMDGVVVTARWRGAGCLMFSVGVCGRAGCQGADWARFEKTGWGSDRNSGSGGLGGGGGTGRGAQASG
jgi:hypothetical protein